LAKALTGGPDRVSRIKITSQIRFLADLSQDGGSAQTFRSRSRSWSMSVAALPVNDARRIDQSRLLLAMVPA
jgi:hypothetical protein